MHSERAKELLKKYQLGTLTAEEQAQLESWYLQWNKLSEIDDEEIQHYLQDLGEWGIEKPSSPLRKWIAVAAAVVLVASLGLSLFTHKTSELSQREFSPGDNKALLIMGNGERISLESKQQGEIIHIGNTQIVKTSDGQLVYQTDNSLEASVSIYHTIETPKAGQYQVVLSDGTKVWLNAASSIHFPVSFNPDERRVEVKGEVYFEVAHLEKNDKRVPFKVITGQHTVEVLGTRFNINSYGDNDKVVTTLVEGKIQIITPKKELVLSPGQQAVVSSSDSPKVKQVNTDQIVAWKEGYFNFNEANLKEIMQEISRWYDIEVQFKGEISEHEFVGRISRNTPLESIIKILEAGGVKLKLEENKLKIYE